MYAVKIPSANRIYRHTTFVYKRINIDFKGVYRSFGPFIDKGPAFFAKSHCGVPVMVLMSYFYGSGKFIL